MKIYGQKFIKKKTYQNVDVSIFPDELLSDINGLMILRILFVWYHNIRNFLVNVIILTILRLSRKKLFDLCDPPLRWKRVNGGLPVIYGWQQKISGVENWNVLMRCFFDTGSVWNYLFVLDLKSFCLLLR